jgi:hypothetical protein
MPIPARCLAIACTLLCLPAQERVALPHETGAMTVPAGWTVLRATELAAPARATDPEAEPARTMLLTAIAQVQQQQRTAEHVICHMPGAAPGSLRMVNAYSAAGRTTAEELVTAESAEAIRETLEPLLRSPGTTVTYAGHADAKLCPIGSLVLRFQLASADLRWELQHHVVPAGPRLQYFETLHSADDTEAPAAIAALLATFDGARE